MKQTVNVHVILMENFYVTKEKVAIQWGFTAFNGEQHFSCRTTNGTNNCCLLVFFCCNWFKLYYDVVGPLGNNAIPASNDVTIQIHQLYQSSQSNPKPSPFPYCLITESSNHINLCVAIVVVTIAVASPSYPKWHLLSTKHSFVCLFYITKRSQNIICTTLYGFTMHAFFLDCCWLFDCSSCLGTVIQVLA